MSIFSTYFRLGFFHIFNLQAYDHLVFLLALCAPYVLADWRRVLALVTSFTVGHSLTLGLATLGFVQYNSRLVETLIPVTILLTCGLNLRRAGQTIKPREPVLLTSANLLAAAFGLIHGLGFSSYLRELLGRSSRPVLELLAFNLGVEAGQLLIVLLILILGLITLRILRRTRRDWILVVSGLAAGVALVLLLA
ncbi:HupE/UreJ family protein [Hymenobacter sp. BT175]|uniref:HupE/UreJ family protein n=1 Tax=Hymenobacter translucens TaxID=2886507 RepID=UPI001D0E4B4C|nr:HupE/UreJ family protein [Hymenobacter translucens]MCC2547589.1 HupE/UreJ family protein [Hymenobacter translucens]